MLRAAKEYESKLSVTTVVMGDGELKEKLFGLVDIEAFDCETPVVVSDDGGLKEFIDERVGQVFRSEDCMDFAEKLLLELQTNAKEKKGSYAAKYALGNFSWYSVVNQVIDLYQKVAS